MAKKEGFLQAPSVRALSVSISILWIVSIAVFIVTTAFVFFTLLKSPSPLMKEKGVVYAGSLYLARVFADSVFLWIIYLLRKLIKTVEQGNPFEKRNPAWIRQIAYGIFSWIPLKVFSTIMSEGFSVAVKTDYVVRLLLRDFLMPLFIGMVILIIARVFETGVRMQLDQSLTI